MHWYGGSMAEAVTLSKQRNAIFVVFVGDDNQPSKELADTLDSAAVLERLSDTGNFLAVKLKSGSKNYTFFAQIYQFVPVPSLFFIGRNGTPLEVVCPGVQPEQLATRIDRILEEHRKGQKPDAAEPSTSSQSIREETVNFMETETSALRSQSQPVEKAPEVAPSAPQPTPSVPQPAPSAPQPAPSVLQPIPTVPQAAQKNPADNESAETPPGPAAKVQKTEHHGAEYDVICDGDVCTRRPRAEPGTSRGVEPAAAAAETTPASQEQAPADDKIERAKELLMARRVEKEEKEKELTKEKEKERRAVGQGVAELKRWQADQEMKQIQEERKREKMENNLARQRILEQIAQDRAERRAREQPPPAPPAAPAAPAAASVGDNSGRTRVQFKLPNGEAHTTHFVVTATLEEVQRYVADNLQLSSASHSLWTAFPRRELSAPAATLLQLGLAPSAALLVLPRAPRALPAPAAPTALGGVIAFLTQLFSTMVLQPSHQLYAWLRTRLLPPPPAASPAPPPAAPHPAPPAGGGGARRRGAVRRVTADAADDDDNNTWNGNSTQQM